MKEAHWKWGFIKYVDTRKAFLTTDQRSQENCKGRLYLINKVGRNKAKVSRNKITSKRE